MQALSLSRKCKYNSDSIAYGVVAQLGERRVRTAKVGSSILLHSTTLTINMTIQISDFFGYTAAILTTVAFVPQAWQSWRTRDMSGISLPMYSLFTVGVAFWLVYGISIGSLPVILANAVTLLLAATVLWLKLMEKP